MDPDVVYGGRDGVPFGEDGGISVGLSVFQLRRRDLGPTLDDEGQDLSGFRILSGVLAQVDEGIDGSRELGFEQNAVPAPHLSQRKGT